MRIILPMAGHGKRFAEAGFKNDKPLIEVNGKTLLEWALAPIPATWERVVIVRAEQFTNDLYNALKSAHASAGNQVITLPGSTRGAAMTVLAAAVALPPDEPVACMNCDQYFEVNLDEVTNEALAKDWDGYILTFGEGQENWPGPAWSYAVCSSGLRVTTVIEKPKYWVSDHATVGFYWWRRASDLVRSICSMIANQRTVNGEFYLAPAYNEFLGLSSVIDVRAVPVKEFVGLGTPEQVAQFERNAIVIEP